jgi:oligopeptidase B
VLAYLNGGERLQGAALAVKPLENALYEEIVARLKQDDASVPYRKHGYWYTHALRTGKEHPIFARRKGSLEAPEEIVLDANARGRGA